MTADRLMTAAGAIVALALAPAAMGSRTVIYGVNDGNFASSWPAMASRIAPLGPIQVGAWVRYRCSFDSNNWLAGGTTSDLGLIPPSQPVMVQYLGAASCTPHTAADRRAYARGARALVRRYPNIRELQVWNEPDLAFWRGTVDEYVRLLAAVHDALRGSGVRLLGPGFSPNGLLNASNASMGVLTFAAAVRRFYAEHPRRRRPLLDGFSYHPYWGFDRRTTNATARALDSAWRRLPQPSPRRGLRFWWTETGAESAINEAPGGEFGNGYYGESDYWPEYLHMMGDPSFQANRVATVALKARANPLVAADFNFELGDDCDLSRWQSGLYYVGGVPKPAFYSFRDAIARAR
jgi:hypothetical protein